MSLFKVYSFFISLLSMGVLLSCAVFMFVLDSCSLMIELDMLLVGVLDICISLMMDTYSVVFGLVVITISSCVMLYNGFYMSDEVYYNRFCKLVFLFVLSMLFLVMIPNFLGLMVGWDGLGLTSYLLVVYYQDKRSLGSGTLTVLSNRVGDVLFFIGISLCSGVAVWGFGDLGMEGFMIITCGIVMIGCMTKSAQIPFCAWLPAAMAAPSPVSALVHSSTLVTAGVYVLVRFSSSIGSGWYLFLGVVSSMTMILSAISAVFEPDVKKVVALSTLSQLGVMMLAVSVGAIGVCFFHLVSHAMFKALMFLCVGAVIHFSGIQDLRYLGGFVYTSPGVVGWLVVACLSLSGFPFLSGFYSKDLVIESFMSGSFCGVLFVILSISTLLTTLYSGMMVYKVMFGSLSMSVSGSMSFNLFVMIPCSVLGMGALLGGLIMQAFVLDFNEIFSIFGLMKLLPSVCLTGGVMSFMILVLYKNSQLYWGSSSLVVGAPSVMADFLAKMWFMPPLSSDLFSGSVLGAAGDVKGLIEDGYLEHSLGSESVWLSMKTLSKGYMLSQSDYIGVCMVKGLVFIMLFSMIYFTN